MTGRLRFDQTQAGQQFQAAAGRAGACRQRGAPVGSAKVLVRFQPDGHVASVRVTNRPYASTPTGACIESAFRQIAIAPFEGGPIALGTDVKIW